MPRKETQRNTPAQVLFASLVGTTVEFFDFYIYATAAVLVFPKLFFPAADPAAATLASLATFGIAFFSRPIGSALFGHFGDRIGRKTTLVLALSTMGLSTFAIGVLPTYSCGHSPRRCCSRSAASARASVSAANGAVLSCWQRRMPLPAREPGTACSRNWARPSASCCRVPPFCCSPGGSAPRSFWPSAGGCRSSPSGVLVLLGLYVRLTITETPVFAAAMERREAVKVPIFSVVRNYFGVLVAGTLSCFASFVIFYLMIVFTLTWATSVLHYSRNEFLLMQLAGVVFFALTIPVASVLAELGRTRS